MAFRLAIAAVSTVLVIGCSSVSQPDDVAVPFTTLATFSTNSTMFATPTNRLISDEASWKQMWDEVASAGTPRPDVDFSSSSVAILGSGNWSEGGHLIYVKGALAQGSTLLVTATILVPTRCATAQIVEQPITIVRIAGRYSSVTFDVLNVPTFC